MSRRKSPDRRRLTRFRPLFEALEARRLLHAEGIVWESAPDLTISFAPDGTDIAGYSSGLFSQFESVEQSEPWQDTVVRAFRTWADETNAQITVVEDSGDDFGIAGPTQGDPRFGDIRVGALPLSADILAMSIPHSEAVSGTWAGDVLFNSNADVATTGDLFSVALHEAGHVFGVGHSQDPDSPMYVHGISDVRTLTAADVANLQELYGLNVEARDSDSTGDEAHENRDEKDHAEQEDDDDHDNDGRTNGLLENSDVLTVSADFENVTRYQTTGTIATSGDVDFFELAPSDLDIDDREYLTVTIRSSQRDSLIPDATILDDRGKELETRVLASASGLLVLQADDADPEESQYIRVEAAQGDESFQSGGYSLHAQFVGREAELDLLTSGTLDEENTDRLAALEVKQTQLVHFALTATADTEGDEPLIAWATVYDGQGSIVVRLATPSGETRSAPTVLLQPGEYRLEFHASGPGETPLSEVHYELGGLGLSVPTGPRLSDPTSAPITRCADQEAGAENCDEPATLIVTDPVTLPNEPVIVADSPWDAIDWWYWDTLASLADGESAASRSFAEHNNSRAADVNGDSSISPADALMIINYLNSAGAAWQGFLDVSNDLTVSPVDALLVINELNGNSQSAAEGEAGGQVGFTNQPLPFATDDDQAVRETVSQATPAALATVSGNSDLVWPVLGESDELIPQLSGRDALDRVANDVGQPLSEELLDSLISTIADDLVQAGALSSFV